MGTVKHVSVVNTSKSQPYALEVLMEESTPLLLACDNDLLRAEWMKAFTDIINEVAEKQMKNAQVASTLKGKNFTRRKEIEGYNTIISKIRK